MVRRNTSNVNSPSKSAVCTIATLSVCVCRFGVSLYSSMASMPLSRFTFHPRLYRSTTAPTTRGFRANRLFEAAAAVDGQCDAGDEAGFVGGEEEHGVGDVFGLNPADRQSVHQLADDLHVLGARVLQVGTEQLHGSLVHEQRGVHVGRVH